MEARDRRLREWFNRIRSGQLRLPRFQRGEEWTHNEIQNLLGSVATALPVGAALILEVGDKEPFVSRPMQGAPEPTERAVEHLLDGQQRLTALWRALHDSYERHSYFIRFPDPEGSEATDPEIEVVVRWWRKGQRYPVWADSARQLCARRLVPLRLFRPEDIGGELREWCDEATQGDVVASRELELKAQALRAKVAEFNIPFLSLPPSTRKDVALDVFIKMNTSFVRLTPFDILVAQTEARTGRSLLDLLAELRSAVPEIDLYGSASDLVLSIAALRQDRAQSQYFALDLDRLVAEWNSLVSGVRWLVELLTEERIFDSVRLPTVAVLPVIAALHDHVPAALDERGNARRLMRKYLWRAFLTGRYGSSAGTNAFQDYRALKRVLQGDVGTAMPIFDETLYPYPTSTEDLKDLRWPKTRQILARGILAVALKAGGIDVADGSPVSRANVRNREYHHLFPESLLADDGHLPPREVYRALNCALISWNTNRNISAKAPLAYLQERTRRSGLGEELGDGVVRERLRSHLIPFAALAVGGYADIADAKQKEERIRQDYESFVDARAAMFLGPIKILCDGGVWPAY